MEVFFFLSKGLGSRRGEIGPAIEMHTDLKYVYMVYFIVKNRNFICLVLKLCKLWVSKDKDPLLILRKKERHLHCNVTPKTSLSLVNKFMLNK